MQDTHFDTLHVRVPVTLARQVDEEAVLEQRTRSNMVVRLLTDGIARRRQPDSQEEAR